MSIVAKCWRLIKGWYEGASCQVRLKDGMLSSMFLIERSEARVHSFTCFVFIFMDLLLREIIKGVWPRSLSEQFLHWSFLHACRRNQILSHEH